RPYGPFAAPGGETRSVWVTIHGAANTPAGVYTGLLEIGGVGLDPIEVVVNVEVFDFTLPTVPSLKADFGFDLTSAAAQLGRAGVRGGADAVWTSAADVGAAARVTFRDVASLPVESADYGRSLAGFEGTLQA